MVDGRSCLQKILIYCSVLMLTFYFLIPTTFTTWNFIIKNSLFIIYLFHMGLYFILCIQIIIYCVQSFAALATGNSSKVSSVFFQLAISFKHFTFQHRLIMHFPFSRPTINYFSKERWFLLFKYYVQKKRAGKQVGHSILILMFLECY